VKLEKQKPTLQDLILANALKTLLKKRPILLSAEEFDETFPDKFSYQGVLLQGTFLHQNCRALFLLLTTDIVCLEIRSLKHFIFNS
jgi:cytochrome oxidase assembly protein ShyY1